MIARFLAFIGAFVLDTMARIGFVSRSFVKLLGRLPGALKRPTLISEQIHFIGN
jgi:phospholipid/cholesterol/gamma-HCH transport system permease protein